MSSTGPALRRSRPAGTSTTASPTSPARRRATPEDLDVHAVDDANLLGVLERNGARAALEAGELKCAVCGQRLAVENFGAVARRRRSLVFACATWLCRRTIA